VLFRIDRARYDIALKQAEAVLLRQTRNARRGQRRPDALQCADTRRRGLQARMDQVVATQGSAQAAHDQAVADLGLAKLNLARMRGTRPPSMASSPIWSCVQGPISLRARE